jgi:ribosomal protein S18 acetylase RimI-like enzyme
MTDKHFIITAQPADLPELAALVNAAYRGESARLGWAHEGDIIGGQRTDVDSLAADLAGPNPSTILCLRKQDDGPILACVFLEKMATPDQPTRCYLGMLSVSPTLQDSGLGRAMLEAGERQASAWGAATVTMTVIHLRDTLIAWYERRGYRRTGETEPFPYGDERFGIPRRDDLYFVVLEKALA